jgi:hypothetical protein
MRNKQRHINIASLCIVMLLATVQTLLTGCRRDLYVIAEHEKQIELITDWSKATQKPGGMTWWFMRNDHSGYNRHETTAAVTHTWIGVPRGQYTGIVFDYSPAEYSHQGFVDMTTPESALMLLTPAADQPRTEVALVGRKAVPEGMTDVPLMTADGETFMVSANPENINVATLENIEVLTGSDDDYIPYEDRNKTLDAADIQTIYAKPEPILWRIRVIVHVKNIDRLYTVRGSVAGLADGSWLASHRHTSSRCLQILDGWKINVPDVEGYITAEQNCLGLPDLEMPASPIYARGGSPQPASEAAAYDKMLRLNLSFLMRDNKTVVDYHYDLDEENITVYDDQRLIVVRIPSTHPDCPDLPEVDGDGKAGFDADVSDWEEGGQSDTTF